MKMDTHTSYIIAYHIYMGSRLTFEFPPKDVVWFPKKPLRRNPITNGKTWKKSFISRSGELSFFFC